VNTFHVVDVVEEAPQMRVGPGEVLVVRQIDFLFLDGADDVGAISRTTCGE
jgi:hypothetical protein